jgi:hypothetical protein
MDRNKNPTPRAALAAVGLSSTVPLVLYNTGMRINANTAIVGDTVILVPYRYVLYSKICMVVGPFIPRTEHVEVRVAICSSYCPAHKKMMPPAPHVRKTEIPHMDAERGTT